MSKGRSIRLFLLEGTPTGLMTAEIMNWTGHVLAGPRTRLEAALKEEELKRTGVYIIFGDDGESDLPRVYIGEGDDISLRLRQHAKDPEKEFWERFVAVTSKDMNLTKAHVKYLEGRLITLLREAKKAVSHNRTEPDFTRLPRADISDMDTFLEELQLVLPVIGVDFFRRPKTETAPSLRAEAPLPHFVTSNGKKGIRARAVETEGEFVVLSGSTGSLNESVSFTERYQALREKAFESGQAIRVNAETFRLDADIAFTSPSAAAVFLFGTSRNGRTDWLLEGSSLTYGAWKDQQIDAAE
ncbi:GIY-YIG nuclease family protein [Thioclava sp. GXIMD4215]|uniref:GIY-YIG nuclease family protein n=1 Tax=Thioclava sp. GXIMD4215 TaxID=3131928 RepID=UPI0032530FD6